MKKNDIQGILWFVFIVIPSYALYKLAQHIGWIYFIFIALVIVGLVVWYEMSKINKRRASLLKKYKDEHLVESLLNQEFWQGQTAEQLLDSLGKPHGIDEKVLKTQKSEVWKYEHQGGSEYNLRITLENDFVIGWDKKG